MSPLCLVLDQVASSGLPGQEKSLHCFLNGLSGIPVVAIKVDYCGLSTHSRQSMERRRQPPNQLTFFEPETNSPSLSLPQVETVIENSRGEAAAEVAEDALGASATTGAAAAEDRSPSKVKFEEVNNFGSSLIPNLPFPYRPHVSLIRLCLQGS